MTPYKHYGVSKHQRLDCLFNRLFRRRSKKTSKPHVTGLCKGIHRSSVDSPHKGPVKRNFFSLLFIFSFHDLMALVSMLWYIVSCNCIASNLNKFRQCHKHIMIYRNSVNFGGQNGWPPQPSQIFTRRGSLWARFMEIKLIRSIYLRLTQKV